MKHIHRFGALGWGHRHETHLTLLCVSWWLNRCKTFGTEPGTWWASYKDWLLRLAHTSQEYPSYCRRARLQSVRLRQGATWVSTRSPLNWISTSDHRQKPWTSSDLSWQTSLHAKMAGEEMERYEDGSGGYSTPTLSQQPDVTSAPVGRSQENNTSGGGEDLMLWGRRRSYVMGHPKFRETKNVFLPMIPLFTLPGWGSTTPPSVFPSLNPAAQDWSCSCPLLIK